MLTQFIALRPPPNKKHRARHQQKMHDAEADRPDVGQQNPEHEARERDEQIGVHECVPRLLTQFGGLPIIAMSVDGWETRH